MKRECGSCNLCCSLLPVRDRNSLFGTFDKPANTRCVNQRHTGCRVYGTAQMPMSCRLWNCRWIVNADTADLSRPDRVHYVIDVMPDFITVHDNETGAQSKIEVVQIWVDPKHRDAHRDPALRKYLERRGEEGVLALIRYSPSEAFVLAPPVLTGRGWVEMTSGVTKGPQHSVAEIREALNNG